MEALQRFVIPNARPTGVPLGKGSYGSVEEVEANGIICAGKIIYEILIDRENVGAEGIARKYVEECQLMSDLRHPHLVQFLGVCFLPNSTLPVLVMERLLTSLDDLIEHNPDIPLSLKRSILADVARGLVFLHSRSPPVIHRDLSAKNVLLNSAMVAKISDLGNARIANFQSGRLARSLTRIPGTMVYMPPEAFDMKADYGPRLDSFSFGHLALFTVAQVFPVNLLTHNYPDPWNPDHLLARTEVQRRAEYIQLLHRQLGDQHPLVTLVEQCLHNIPSRRPSAQELLQQLEDMRAQIEDPHEHLTKLEAMKLLRDKDKEVQQLQLQVQASTEEIISLQDHVKQLQLEKDYKLTETERALAQKDAEISRLMDVIGSEQESNSMVVAMLESDLETKETQIQQLQIEHEAEINRLIGELQHLQSHTQDIQECNKHNYEVKPEIVFDHYKAEHQEDPMWPSERTIGNLRMWVSAPLPSVGYPSKVEARSFLIEAKGDLQKAVDECYQYRVQKIEELRQKMLLGGKHLPWEGAMYALTASDMNVDVACWTVQCGELQPLYDYIFSEWNKKSQTDMEDIKKLIKRDDLDSEIRCRLLMGEYKLENQDRAQTVIQLMHEVEIDDDTQYPLHYPLHYYIGPAKDFQTLEGARNFLIRSCPICYEDVIPTYDMVTMPGCTDEICKECFIAHFSLIIKEKTVMHFNCPVCGEPDLAIEDMNRGLYLELFVHMIKQHLDEECDDLCQQKVADFVQDSEQVTSGHQRPQQLTQQGTQSPLHYYSEAAEDFQTLEEARSCPMCFMDDIPTHDMVTMPGCSEPDEICKECFKLHFSLTIKEKTFKHFNCPVCGEPDLANGGMSQDPYLEVYLELFLNMIRQHLDEECYDLCQQKLREANFWIWMHDDQLSQEECSRLEQELQHQREQSMQAVQQLQHTQVTSGHQKSRQLTRQEVLIFSEIGRGSFAIVAKGKFRGHSVAVKYPHPEILNEDVIEHFRREVQIMAQVSVNYFHPLVQFIGAVFDDQLPPLIVTELLDMNLRMAYERGRLTGFSKIPIFQDVAYALHYLHEHQEPIIHRNVNSTNILLQECLDGRFQAKVSGFGSANLVQLAQTPVPGAILYTAPEAFPPTHDLHSHTPLQTTKMDVYSYGILLCEVITSQLPEPDKLQSMLQQVQRQWPFMYDLIITCTKRSPDKRPTMADVLDKLNELPRQS